MKNAMNNEKNDYTATQTDEGFLVEFHDPIKPPLSITNKDFQAFAMKVNQVLLTGKDMTFSEKEEVLLNLWQMLLIPEHTIH